MAGKPVAAKAAAKKKAKARQARGKPARAKARKGGLKAPKAAPKAMVVKKAVAGKSVEGWRPGDIPEEAPIALPMVDDLSDLEIPAGGIESKPLAREAGGAVAVRETLAVADVPLIAPELPPQVQPGVVPTESIVEAETGMIKPAPVALGSSPEVPEETVDLGGGAAAAPDSYGRSPNQMRYWAGVTLMMLAVVLFAEGINPASYMASGLGGLLTIMMEN